MSDFATTKLFLSGTELKAIPHSNAGTIAPLQLTSNGGQVNHKGTVIDEVVFEPARAGLVADRHAVEIADSSGAVSHRLALVIPEYGKAEATQSLSGGGVAPWRLTVKTKPKVITPPLSD